jgi:hypothetical protein
MDRGLIVGITVGPLVTGKAAPAATHSLAGMLAISTPEPMHQQITKHNLSLP